MQQGSHRSAGGTCSISSSNSSSSSVNFVLAAEYAMVCIIKKLLCMCAGMRSTLPKHYS